MFRHLAGQRKSSPRYAASRIFRNCHSASQIFAGILVVVLMLPCLEISGARAQIPRLAIIGLAHGRCSRVHKSSRGFEIFPFHPGSLLALEVCDQIIPGIDAVFARQPFSFVTISIRYGADKSLVLLDN
jgi:hypothetical protein